MNLLRRLFSRTPYYERLSRKLDKLNYHEAVEVWSEAFDFQSHIQEHWADEAERRYEEAMDSPLHRPTHNRY